MSRGPDQGLGDTLHRLITALGLHHLARLYTRLTGRPCRCDERREWLNQVFSYRKNRSKF